MPKSQAANAIAHIRCVPCAAIVTIDFGVQKHANMCESLGCKYLAEHCKIIWKSIGPYLRDSSGWLLGREHPPKAGLVRVGKAGVPCAECTDLIRKPHDLPTAWECIRMRVCVC